MPLTTGIAPGRPRQIGQTWVLGSAPNVVGQPQNILVAVFELDVHLEAEGRVERGQRVVEGQQCSAGASVLMPTPPSSGARSSSGPPHCVEQGCLERGADAVEPVVGQRRRQDLDADRQAVLGGQPAGHRDAAVAGQVGRDRGQVVEVHRQRVVELLPQRERRRRAVGDTSTSACSKAAAKSRLISVRTFCAWP